MPRVGRIRRGWELTKTSWGVLRSDRSLGAFPVLGGASALLLAAAFGLPAALLFNDDSNVLAVILAAIGIYLVSYAAVFFNVALAGAAAQVLDGKDATVASGVAVARTRLPAIAGWALMIASVNIVIRALQERLGPVGDLILGGIAVAWGLVTFLAVPVIALENTGPIETLRRSAGIFRERWGEQVTGQFSIGGIVLLFTFLPAIALVGIGYAVGNGVLLGVLIAVAVVLVIVGAIVSTALSQIFAVALYRYAVGQGATGAFTEDVLAGAVRPRTRRGTI
jgi:Family of unknown function (DUF6159)